MNEQQFQVPARPLRLARLTILLLAFAGLIIAGCTALRVSAPEMRADTLAAGRQVYVANCVICHGEKGDRVPVAPLNVKEFLDLRGDVTLVHVISEGKGVMPAFGQMRGGPLARDQIGAVVAYLNASAGRTSPTILAISGRTIFNQHCLNCHGDKGDRIPAVPLTAKNFLDSRTDSQLFDVISDGKGQMPAYRTGVANPLTEDQVKALVSYLRYNAATATAEEARQGRDLYNANCLACHGERGDRVPNVALSSPDLLLRLGDGKLTSVISYGSGVMPGFAPAKGGTLEAQQIGALLVYLKSAAGLPADSALVGSERSGQGRDLYVNNCAGCHGEGGDRVAGVPLRSREYLESRSEDALERQISQGNTRGMPAWGQAAGGPLSPADIKSLIEYLRSGTGTASTSGGEAAPPTAPKPASSPGGDALAARGKDIYTKSCAMCHGETRDKVPLAKLADADWLRQRGDEAIAQSIANGKGSMPYFGKEKGGALSQEDIEAVLAYVKSAAVAPATPTQNGGAAPGANTTRGKDIYTKSCAVCHGDTRDKTPTANLADADWLQQRGDAILGQSIANGKGLMPAWGKEKGGPLSQDDIDAVLDYLKTAARSGSAPPASTASRPDRSGELALSIDAARGRDVYTTNCKYCHGETLDRIPAAKLADADWLQERGDAALADSIANGKGAMPAWGEEKGGPIGKADIQALLAFFKALANGGG